MIIKWRHSRYVHNLNSWRLKRAVIIFLMAICHLYIFFPSSKICSLFAESNSSRNLFIHFLIFVVEALYPLTVVDNSYNTIQQIYNIYLA